MILVRMYIKVQIWQLGILKRCGVKTLARQAMGIWNGAKWQMKCWVNKIWQLRTNRNSRLAYLLCQNSTSQWTTLNYCKHTDCQAGQDLALCLAEGLVVKQMHKYHTDGQSVC